MSGFTRWLRLARVPFSTSRNRLLFGGAVFLTAYALVSYMGYFDPDLPSFLSGTAIWPNWTEQFTIAEFSNLSVPSISASRRIFWFYDEHAAVETTYVGKLFAELSRLQNPADCSNARICLGHYHPDSGFGAQMHTVGEQLLACHASNRVLVLSPNHFRYALDVCPDASNDCFFERLSTCRSDRFDGSDVIYSTHAKLMRSFFSRALVVKLPWKTGHTEWREVYLPENGKPPSILYQYGPGQWGMVSKAFKPFVPRWYWAHIMAFQFRPNKKLRDELATRMQAVKYGTDDFTIGIQLRGGNKAGEVGVYWRLHVYVYFAERWLARQPAFVAGKSSVGIYLMTDEPQANNETALFPQYRWMVRNEVDTVTEFGANPVKQSQAFNVVIDVMLVAASDFSIGLFDSNLGRLVMELGIAYHPGKLLEDVSCQLSLFDRTFGSRADFQKVPYCLATNSYD